jgi:hypothetical protein
MKITFPLALLLIFIVLKLCNIIAWSWLWVLSPLWIPIAVAVLIYVAVLIVALTAAVLAERNLN